MGGLKYTGFAILAVVLVISFGFQTGSTMPDNAILLVDMEKKVYYLPTYVRDFGIMSSNLVQVRQEDIAGKGYEPDSNCQDAGYFSAEDQSSWIVYRFKELLVMNKKRWNEDGTWNW